MGLLIDGSGKYSLSAPVCIGVSQSPAASPEHMGLQSYKVAPSAEDQSATPAALLAPKAAAAGQQARGLATCALHGGETVVGLRPGAARSGPYSTEKAPSSAAASPIRRSQTRCQVILRARLREGCLAERREAHLDFKCDGLSSLVNQSEHCRWNLLDFPAPLDTRSRTSLNPGWAQAQ